jgi:multidrug efflux system membrane fusion protein
MQRTIASLALCLLCSTAGAARYPAQLDWSQRLVLSTPASGIVSATPVAAGARVEQGQLLVQLDERPFRSALRDATAQVHRHKLDRDEAERELERTRELYDRRVISVHDLQLQEIAFAGAESDYASAQAALDAARLHLEYSSIRAPFSGLVLEVAVAPGETVVNTQEATPMVTLVRDHPMSAVARVEQAELGRLSVGQPASVDVSGRRYQGKVARLSAEPDTSGRYTVVVSFEPGDSLLPAGLAAQIETSP